MPVNSTRFMTTPYAMT